MRKNVFLKDMNVEVGAEDARQIEVLAQDLPCFGGVAQLAVDVTLRCVLSLLRRRGSPARGRLRGGSAAESAGRADVGGPEDAHALCHLCHCFCCIAG